MIAINTIQSKAYDANSFTEKLRVDEPPEWAILWYSDIRRHPALDDCRGKKRETKPKSDAKGRDVPFLKKKPALAELNWLSVCCSIESGCA